MVVCDEGAGCEFVALERGLMASNSRLLRSMGSSSSDSSIFLFLQFVTHFIVITILNKKVIWNYFYLNNVIVNVIVVHVNNNTIKATNSLRRITG